MPTPWRPQKQHAGLAGSHPNPLVRAGDPARGDTTGSKTNPTCSCHCMVALATSPPGHRTSRSRQTQIATVMLGDIGPPASASRPGRLPHRGSRSGKAPCCTAVARCALPYLLPGQSRRPRLWVPSCECQLRSTLTAEQPLRYSRVCCSAPPLAIPRSPNSFGPKSRSGLPHKFQTQPLPSILPAIPGHPCRRSAFSTW